jgi:hypothetical protein
MLTAKEEMPTEKEWMPTEKAGRLIQYLEYVYRDVSGNKAYSTNKDASSTLTLILVRYFLN